MLKNFLWVGAGGALGSMLRFATENVFKVTLLKTPWPLATISVNLIGCFLIGLLGGLAGLRFDLPQSARLFLISGVLGGFTTFSAFGLESYKLFVDHSPILALSNVVFQVVGGIVLCAAGFSVAAHV